MAEALDMIFIYQKFDLNKNHWLLLSPSQSEEQGDSRCREITGLRNDSHQSCNVISALHLLCQTSLPGLSTSQIIHENCQAHGPCLLKQFFLQYQSCAKFYPHSLVDNSNRDVFNVEIFPQKVPELIRQALDYWETDSFILNFSLFIRTVLENTPREEVSYFKDEFLTIIEWKFECQSCKRFVKTRFEDFLLKISANEPKSFKSHLNCFLQNKTCICRQTTSTKPELRQGRNPLIINKSLKINILFGQTQTLLHNFQRFDSAGEWLFVEVDRSQDIEENSEESEVALYPLNLVTTYNILDQQYEIFATVNLNLGTRLAWWSGWF